MAVTREEIIEALKEMSLLEASELVKDIEETFGVSAAAPVAVAAAAPAEGGAAAEEKSDFDVVLEGFGDNKIAVIKVVREITGLGLKAVSYTHLGHGGPTVDFEFLANDFHLPSKKWLALIIVLALLVIAGAYWWFHPAINIHSTDFWGFVFIVILLPLFLVFWMRSKQYKTGTKEVTKNEGKAKTFRILSFVPVAVVALVAIGALMSMAIFPGNAEKYSNVLKTDTLEFAQDIKEVNYSEIPVIDRDSAILLGNREMGSIPEYVSQFEVSNLYSQINYCLLYTSRCV